jgi:hypothetical protein
MEFSRDSARGKADQVMASCLQCHFIKRDNEHIILRPLAIKFETATGCQNKRETFGLLWPPAVGREGRLSPTATSGQPTGCQPAPTATIATAAADSTRIS